MDDFIEIYPDVISPEACQQIIQQFNTSGQAVRGKVGSGLDITLKNSFDITISGKPDWRSTDELLQRATFKGLIAYIQKYPFTMIGPLALRILDEVSGKPKLINADTFPGLNDQQVRDLIGRVFRPGAINLQKYLANEGGYPHWHSELFPRDARGETLHRVLLWTIYLNDVPEAGETEFFYQKRKIRPRTGSLLIAPAFFTHTHRGNMPIGGDKYIATSWILYQRAEALFQS